MKIALASIDQDILLKIKSAMNSDVPIKHRINKCSFTNKDSSISIFSISSQYLVQSIRNLGFDSNKTISCTFPNIPKELYIHFIRGFFDGDGSMSKYITENSIKFSISMCGTESFLLFIKNYLESNYDFKFNTKLYKRFDTENCCYSLKMSGKNNCIRFLSLLYDQSSIFLDRKYNKYLSFSK